MHSPLEVELRTSWHREDLLREAAVERLAQELGGTRQPRLRSRLATLLYAVAARLDPSVGTHVSTRTVVAAR